MLLTLGENRHRYKSVRGAGEAAADLTDFTLLDVIAYGLLHQSYDYCCQLADPRHCFCWENLFVDGQNLDEERSPT
jgi:hypothetical protein